jgi:hypothetical protein
MPFPTKKNRIRPVSRQIGQTRIRELKCFKEVYDRILDGWPLNSIARFIQVQCNECTDLTAAGLVSTLDDFRKTIPPAELTKKRITPVYLNAVNEVEKGLDELAEMEKLYRLQMDRVAIDVKNENNIKKLLPTTGQEVRIAREILSNYADLKMDLGLSKRHLGQVDVDARLLADVAVRYQKPEVATVLNDAQSRKKVLGLAERLLSLKAKNFEVTPVEVVGEPTGDKQDSVEDEVLLPGDPLDGPGEDVDVFADPLVDTEEPES